MASCIFERRLFCVMRVVYQVCCGVDVHKSFLVATIITTVSNSFFPSYKKRRFSTFNKGILEFKAWLLEVNVNPSLHCTSPLDLSIKTELFTDIYNLIGIIPFNHNNGETIYNYETMKNREKERENQNKANKAKYLKLPYLYNVNRNSKFDKALINLKSSVVQNFNIDNLKNRTNEYDNEYYKKIIEIYKEEKARASLTGFEMIFPRKDNIEFYSKIMSKSNSINDTNIVLWEHILNNE
jgi:hypothetical protein